MKNAGRRGGKRADAQLPTPGSASEPDATARAGLAGSVSDEQETSQRERKVTADFLEQVNRSESLAGLIRTTPKGSKTTARGETPGKQRRYA